MREIGTIYGVRVWESRSIPEGTCLIFNARAVADAFRFGERGLIEVEPMDRAQLMKIVLGDRPDWVRDER